MELGWIDYSDVDRQRTMAVLQLLQEPGAIDELGIGIARDAFADRLFPATSTLLTRAKYFFFVPYLMRDLEQEDNRHKNAARLRRDFDDRERKLAEDLIASTEDTRGIVGARALRGGHWVKRGPSVLYWGPIRSLGILKDPQLDMTNYFQILANRSAADRESAPDEKSEGYADDRKPRSSVWHVPKASYKDWQNHRTIDLNQDEAVFLANQIRLRASGTLFDALVSNEEVRNLAYAAETAEPDNPAAGVFSQFISSAKGCLSPDLQELCEHAVAFSDFVVVCRIRYNTMIVGHDEEAQNRWSEIGPYMREFAQKFDIAKTSSLIRLGSHAGAVQLVSFLKNAREAMLADDVNALDSIIKAREIQLKRGLAKIGRPEGVSNEWIGGMDLTYRFNVARNIAREIDEAGGCNV